ncbi:MAG TPA: class A beta-lactamase, subclass A2 [Puia sp.]|nr:class A beta-lactamase, subclass A2 [Puia sp.]
MLLHGKVLFAAFLFSTLLNVRNARAQHTSLRDSIRIIANEVDGMVGVSVLYPERNGTISLHGDDRFPMQSVFKFPLAIKILHDVDNGQLSLDRIIHIDKMDWVDGTWSPMRDRYNGGTVDITLREILRYTVSASDNNGCDILFRLVGGPRKVNEYIHQLGIKDIAIGATEAEMAAKWDVQYENWCTPNAMAALLRLFLDGGILTPTSRELLMQFLKATSTGPHRIKGLLPPGTVVAHKTGTSNTNEKGITAATNDVGIIFLPDGRQLVLVVYIRDSSADEKTRERVIARIASAVWASHNSE